MMTIIIVTSVVGTLLLRVGVVSCYDITPRTDGVLWVP